MNRLILVLCIFVVFSNTLSAANKIFYDITFSSPEHTVGEVTATGDLPTMPSAIVFGSPIVSESLGLLTDQSLVFNTAGNQASFYYDQIELKLERNASLYYFAFDVYTENLIGTTNHFAVLFDTPTVRNIYFESDGSIALLNRFSFQKIGTFTDNSLMHCEVILNMEQKTWTIFVNYDQLHSGLFYPDADLRSVRFCLGLKSGIDEPCHATNVGLDNIIVANYIVSQPCRPVADAGEDQFVPVDQNCVASVCLDGIKSYDFDGASLSYKWFWAIKGQLYEACGANPTIELPIGENKIQLIVNNGTCDSVPNDLLITVIDNIAPELEVSVDPCVLWSANHKMVLVTPSTTAWDNCCDEPQVSLVSVTSNEPNDGSGKCRNSEDILVDEDGNIYLRAERNGNGTDRKYTLTYTATDATGNCTQAAAVVTVPHDMRNYGKLSGNFTIQNKPSRKDKIKKLITPSSGKN